MYAVSWHICKIFDKLLKICFTIKQICDNIYPLGKLAQFGRASL